MIARLGAVVLVAACGGGGYSGANDANPPACAADGGCAPCSAMMPCSELQACVGGYCTAPPPGPEWTVQTSGVSADLDDVSYGDGKFVAVGGTTLITSPDGVSWTGHTLEDSASGLDAVAFGAGVFVAGGTALVESPDGVTWTTTPYPSNAGLTRAGRVAYGNGVFMMIGANTVESYWYQTADGVGFNSGGILPMSPYSAAYGHGKWIVVGAGDGTLAGDARSSTNGAPFVVELIPQIPLLTAVTYVASSFVAVGSGVIVTRADATGQWQQQTSITFSPGEGGQDTDADYLAGVTSGDGLIVAVGAVGAAGGGGSAVILTSTDTASWTRRVVPQATSLRGIAYGDGKFVAVGAGGAILTSN